MPSEALIDKLKRLVGTGDVDDDALSEDLELAVELVDRYLKDFGLAVDEYDEANLPPEVVKNRAVIQVAADLFDRRKFQSGYTGAAFGGEDTDPVPVVAFNRDPLASARDLLRPYVLEVSVA